MKSFLSITVLFLLIGATSIVHASDLKKELKGTWNYEAPQAPYEYQKGKILFFEEEGESKVKIVTDNGTILAKTLEVKDEQVTFTFYVDYEFCKALLTYKDKKLTGKVETSQGDIPVTMTRQEVK